LAALAAYRAGVDLVTLAAPARAADAAAHSSPDLITIALEGDFLTRGHIPRIILELKTADAVVIGGGLGERKETFKAVAQLLGKIEQPLLLDAAALRTLGWRVRSTKGKYELIRKLIVSEKVVLTPHGDELRELLDRKSPPSSGLEERKKLARELAAKLGVVVLLKGHQDVIADPDRVAVNETGSPYMTVGGTGDLLAGICGALLAQGLEPFAAARQSAWLNGKAGELAAAEFGESLMASDILNYYHQALREKRAG
jgi:NAD(P)H-hydrate epimerase